MWAGGWASGHVVGWAGGLVGGCLILWVGWWVSVLFWPLSLFLSFISVVVYVYLCLYARGWVGE